MYKNKNKKCSIDEAICLYVLNLVFPTMGFMNEHKLYEINPNYAIQNKSWDGRRKFDIYSEKYRIAIETSRSRAHGKESIDRDTVKENFATSEDITLYHLRDVDCSKIQLKNNISYTESKGSSIIQCINALSKPLDILINKISTDFDIAPATNVKYSACVNEIKELYYEISGKEYLDLASFEKLNKHEIADRIGSSFKVVNQYAKNHNCTFAEAALCIHNNATQIHKKTGIRTHSQKDTILLENYISDKDKEIQRLKKQNKKLKEELATITVNNTRKKDK